MRDGAQDLELRFVLLRAPSIGVLVKPLQIHSGPLVRVHTRDAFHGGHECMMCDCISSLKEALP